jgi:nucleotide-binding universal stress UspA family protein
VDPCPEFEELNDEDAEAVIWSANAERRHMTKGQMAMVAAEALLSKVSHGCLASGRHRLELAMYKYILVPATGAGTDGPVFSTALTVARLMPAHLAFLHVRLDFQATLMAMANSDTGGGYGCPEMLETFEQEAANRQKRAELAFRDFCEAERLLVSADPSASLPSADWRIETGDEAYWVAEHGRAADLIVLGRYGHGAPGTMDVVEAAMMESGRPVLIAPNQARRELSGVVAIAWKDRREAARAIAAAQPFLQVASKVVILSVSEETRSNESSCERLRRALSWQNSATSVNWLKPERRPPVETLLVAAHSVNADVLVMGGYSHSRTREIIFGGFTRRILSDADLPVLIAR